MVRWAGIIRPILQMTKLEVGEMKQVAQGYAQTVATTLRQSPILLILNPDLSPLWPCPQHLASRPKKVMVWLVERCL